MTGVPGSVARTYPASSKDLLYDDPVLSDVVPNRFAGFSFFRREVSFLLWKCPSCGII